MMAGVVLASLALEAVVGYPAAVHAWVPHPVVWAGNAISALERWWNKPRYSFGVRRALGVAAVLLVIGAAGALGFGVEWGVGRLANASGCNAPSAGLLGRAVAVVGDGTCDAVERVSRGGAVVHGGGWVASLVGLLLVALVGTTGLAQRSLFEHVNNVLLALRSGDLSLSRQRVSLIVGRDTQQLDANAVSAAALESLAESFNDGIVAPVFWFVIAGLPGLFVYKVLNTADSLIGHKEERWRAFGWAAARADDLLNLVPARIAGALLVLAGFGGYGVMLSDASKHASPNAGWPEAAMAGALGVSLGGPTSYDGVMHERPVFGNGPAPGVSDLRRGLRIYVVACGLLWLIVAAVAIVAAAAGRI
jgi:adenosylcobinamide-phosphate synthase